MAWNRLLDFAFYFCRHIRSPSHPYFAMFAGCWFGSNCKFPIFCPTSSYLSNFWQLAIWATLMNLPSALLKLVSSAEQTCAGGMKVGMIFSTFDFDNIGQNKKKIDPFLPVHKHHCRSQSGWHILEGNISDRHTWYEWLMMTINCTFVFNEFVKKVEVSKYLVVFVCIYFSQLKRL